MTNKELCRVVWGVFVHNVLHEYPFIVNELLFYVSSSKYAYFCSCCSIDREGSISLPLDEICL